MRLPSKRKIATTANPSTDTIRCVLNPSGLWPSTRNLNSSPNYFQHSIFSTALLLSVVSPDNSFDLITDRDEFPSHNVRPGIIQPLCIYGGPASTVADLWSVEKPSFRPGRLKILLKIPNCFFFLIFHVPHSLFLFAPLSSVPCGIVLTAHLTFTAESMTSVQGKHWNIVEKDRIAYTHVTCPSMDA